MKRTAFLLVLTLCLTGCIKQASAPVPGSANSLDATAFRITADAQAGIEVIKIWQQCSVNNFPATIVVDGTTQPCDSSAGVFPASYKDDLNLAIKAFNTLAAAGQAYHSGASNDAQGLTNAMNQLSAAIGSLLSEAASSLSPSSPTAAAVKVQLAHVQGGK